MTHASDDMLGDREFDQLDADVNAALLIDRAARVEDNAVRSLIVDLVARQRDLEEMLIDQAFRVADLSGGRSGSRRVRSVADMIRFTAARTKLSTFDITRANKPSEQGWLARLALIRAASRIGKSTDELASYFRAPATTIGRWQLMAELRIKTVDYEQLTAAIVAEFQSVAS